MTMSCAFLNTQDTHFGVSLFRVTSPTKNLRDLPCLFENPRFVNVMSNNNVYVTLIIHISFYKRKVFQHDAWCRRWPI